MACILLLGTFIPAMAGGEGELFNRMLPADKLEALTGNPAKFCVGTVPDAFLGDYAGKGDQNVSFRLLRAGDKLVMVYAYEYQGVNASVLGGDFKTDGDKVIFNSDSGKLKIVFEAGGAFVRYDGFRLFKTNVVKTN